MDTSHVPNLEKGMDKVKVLKQFPPYGSINGSLAGVTCPTCRGTGRIPRGQEDQLVAVIPCNDVRLKPRHTKLYVCISMAACLLFCCLILFFLFPRSVTLSPVSVLSVMVYFTSDTVEIGVTSLGNLLIVVSSVDICGLIKNHESTQLFQMNRINITNENFVPVQIVEFDMQGLVGGAIMGKNKISNMTAIQSRSRKSYTVQMHLSIRDKGLNNYCKSSSIKIRTLFLELQMTMNISYLSHTEQVSLDTYEFIDCGTNSTIPHPVRR